MTANSEVRTNEEATVYVKQLDLFVKVLLLQETPAVLSLVKLCEEHGYKYHSKSGQNPHLVKNGKRIDCNVSNYLPFVVPGIPASSSSSTPSSASSPSSSQESTSENRDWVSKNRDVEAPVPERRESTSGELLGDPLHDSTETENQNKNIERSTKRYIAWIAWLATGIQVEFGWWKYFRRSSVRPDAEKCRHFQFVSWTSKGAASIRGTGFGKHSVFTHFPKDPNCEICFKTKLTRASCRRRANVVMPRAENFGELITADHKVLSEESAPRKNHRYARGGTRLGNPVVTVPPVQNNNFPRNAKRA